MSAFDDALHAYAMLKKWEGMFHPHICELSKAMGVFPFEWASPTAIESLLCALVKEKLGVNLTP